MSEVKSTRICVKNIPKYADEKRVREYFSSRGAIITDAKVLKNKNGMSRQVAFVGFRNQQDADKTLEYFNKTFFDTCKINLSYALPYGDAQFHGKHGNSKAKATSSGNDGKRKRADGTPEVSGQKKSKQDPKLSEFLTLMQPRNQSQFWSNDDSVAIPNGDDESSSSSEDEEDHDDVEEEAKPLEKIEGKNNKHDSEELTMDLAAETGRLFVRNLCYDTSEEELKEYFGKFGPISEVHIPTDESKRSRGFGYVLFVIPEHAVQALASTDGRIFQGRLLHVLPALTKASEESEGKAERTKDGSFKSKKDAKRKEQAEDTQSWNALFVRSDAAVGAVAEQLGVSKRDVILATHSSDDEGVAKGPSDAVRVALAETRVINETKTFLREHGVDLDILEQGVRDPQSIPRSKVTILVKNLPHQTDEIELRQMFAKCGDMQTLVVPPSKTMALVSYYTEKDAKNAFKSLAYKRYKRVPIYLEWAPENVLGESTKSANKVDDAHIEEDQVAEITKIEESVEEAEQPTEAQTAKGPVLKAQTTVFIKNLSFETREEALKSHLTQFVKARDIVHISIPRKVKTQDVDLSYGFGFVELSSPQICKTVLRKVHGSTLDGHILDVKISEKRNAVESNASKATNRKTSENNISHDDASTSKLTKLVIRNLAFEATKKDIKQLCASYGHVSNVRLPKKFDGSHRGFAFVTFVTHQEAKDAFSALSSSHLYGRRLVIEWSRDATTTDE